MKRIDRSLVVVILLGIFVCGGFTILTALRDQSLASMWCAAMTAFTLYNAARIAAINRSMTGSWWDGGWKARR